jgi:hypothetical protein
MPARGRQIWRSRCFAVAALWLWKGEGVHPAASTQHNRRQTAKSGNQAATWDRTPTGRTELPPIGCQGTGDDFAVRELSTSNVPILRPRLEGVPASPGPGVWPPTISGATWRRRGAIPRRGSGRTFRREVRFSLPLDPEGSRPTCAQVETRDSGDMENR